MSNTTKHKPIRILGEDQLLSKVRFQVFDRCLAQRESQEWDQAWFQVRFQVRAQLVGQIEANCYEEFST